MSSPVIPNLVVIGAQKAGSTFLAEAIGLHPQVWMYPTEHPYFEDPDYETISEASFLKLFERGRGREIVGFKRPSYLPSRVAPDRIANDLPGVKAIAVLRDPVDRAVSAYYHMMRAGMLPIRPSSEAFRDYLDGKFDDRYAGQRTAIDWGFYADDLDRWATVVGRENMLVVTFDRLTKDPEQAMGGVCEFLRIDPARMVSVRTDRKPMASVKNLTRLRYMERARRLAMTRTHDRMRSNFRGYPGARKVLGLIDRVDRHALAKVWTARDGKPSKELLGELAERYRSDVDRLSSEWGLDVSGWLRQGG